MTDKILFLAHSEECCFTGEPGNAVYPIQTDTMSGQTFIALSKIGFDMYDPEEFFVLRWQEAFLSRSVDEITGPSIANRGQKFTVADVIKGKNPYTMTRDEIVDSFNEYTSTRPFMKQSWLTPPSEALFYYKVRRIERNVEFYMIVENDGYIIDPASKEGYWEIDDATNIPIDMYFSKKFYRFFGIAEEDVAAVTEADSFWYMDEVGLDFTFEDGFRCNAHGEYTHLDSHPNIPIPHPTVHTLSSSQLD